MPVFSDQRPNILLIMTDQQRWDALGLEGHPVLTTPNLDALGARGIHFTHAHSACPVCIPARRTFLTGRSAAAHGVFCNYHTHLPFPTLPGELSRAGYQTHLVGKLHMHPFRKLCGFMSADMADQPVREGSDGDYGLWLRRHFPDFPQVGQAHGCDQNGWFARPWHLDQRFHFTNWCVDRAIDFLSRRDPTTPFFLNVSFHQPHQPCCPPQYYWDRYMAMDLPEPYVGDWARVYEDPPRGLTIPSWITKLTPQAMKEFRAGYYGTISHIDEQIGRLLKVLPGNTAILFVSDHGEMLGDHQRIRKQEAFEPSVRVPFLLNLPKSMGISQQRQIEDLVELRDIMPTLLELAGVNIPDGVDGVSLLPRLRDETGPIREFLHGECSSAGRPEPTGMQFITTGKRKYIYYPRTGLERFFNLENDPRELLNQIDNSDYAEEIRWCRERLTEQLAGRPEGFVRDGTLQPLGHQPPSCLPEFTMPSTLPV